MRTHYPLLLLTSLALAGCAPVAGSPSVALDDASAAAYQAGRTVQAEQTADAATAEARAWADSATRAAAATMDAWTATSAARTEVYAAQAATVSAASLAATAAALTPTATPIPTDTPVPTSTPAPTWTATPDATAAAYVQDQARAERDNAVIGGWIVNGLLAVVLLVAIALGLYAIGRLYASWIGHMTTALRGRYLFAGSDVLNVMSELWVRETPAAVTVVDQAPPVDRQAARVDQIAESDRWRAMLRVFFQEGDKSGFSLRSMTKPENSKVCSEDDWRRITGYFAASGILRDAGGNIGMTWGHGWDLGRLLAALDRIEPPSGEPAYCLPRTTLHTTAQHSTAQRNTAEIITARRA